MCMKLNNNKRCDGVKRKLLENRINIYFTEGYGNYVTAFQYVNKGDIRVLLSESFPDLDLASSLETSKASKVQLSSKRISDFPLL